MEQGTLVNSLELTKGFELINGFEFAIKHDLTRKEMEVLRLFLDKPCTTPEIAKILEASSSTIHHTIQRLKFKGILILENRNSKGICLYKFNDEL